jgi:GAF domain-containing protein
MKLAERVDRARAHLQLLRERLLAPATGPGRPAEETLALLAGELDALYAEADRLEPTLDLLRLIVTAADSDRMVREAALFFRDWSGVEAVGIRLREGEDFPYFATCGFPESFRTAEASLLAVDREGHPALDPDGRVALECMCGTVIRRRVDTSKSFFTARGSFWTNSTTRLLASTTAAERQGPTRNRCNAAGYESVALIPLRLGDETFGLIQLNDHQPNRFAPDRIGMLETLADYVAAALD